MRKERFQKGCDFLIEMGIVCILSLIIFAVKTITFQESLILFIFLCTFIFGYLQIKPRYIATAFIGLLIIGMATIMILIYRKILAYVGPDKLLADFIVHLKKPPFQIWLVFIILLALYYLYKKIWEVRLGERRLISEGTFIILASIIIYDLTLPLNITFNRYGHTYSLPHTSLLLFLTIFMWSAKLMVSGGEIVFFHRQLAHSYLYTFILLFILITFLFLAISPFYPLDLIYHKGVIQSVLSMLLFATLINAQVSTKRKKEDSN